MEHKKGQEEAPHYVGDSRVSVQQRKYPPRDYARFPGKTEAFWPNFLLREWMVASVFLTGFLLLVMSSPPELGPDADPSGSRLFIPVPDWYFLFMYKWLMYDWATATLPFSVSNVSDLKFVGTVVLPGLLFGSLMLVPWLDTSKSRRPAHRPVTISIMLLSITGIGGLTWAAHDGHKKVLLAPSRPVAPPDATIVEPEHPGYAVFKKNSCVKCHGLNLEGNAGPNLIQVGNYLSPEVITDIIKRGGGRDGGVGKMPGGMIDTSTAAGEQDLADLVDFLSKQKASNRSGLKVVDSKSALPPSTPIPVAKQPQQGVPEKRPPFAAGPKPSPSGIVPVGPRQPFTSQLPPATPQQLPLPR